MEQYLAILLDTVEKHLVYKSILAESMIHAEVIAESFDDERFLILEVAEYNDETGNFIIGVELIAKLPELVR